MQPEIEIEVLRYLNQPNSDRRIYFISQHFRERHPEYNISQHIIMVMAWDWISRGLAYFDISQPAIANWDIRITQKGERFIEDSEENLYNDNIWYANLVRKADGLSEIEKQYAQESIKAFNNELYISCHVMIGVASEAIIIRMAKTMSQSQMIEGKENIEKAVNDPRMSIRELFNKMRPEIEKAKSRIPGNLADNMSIWLDSMFDVIRVNRNEAGHPKGASVGKEECIMILRCFVTYISKACRLINHFEKECPTSRCAGAADAAR